MIVYAVEPGGKYVTVEESLALHPEGKRGFYVNLTNQCTCACTFCLRSLKEMAEEHSLWLKKEPSEEEVWAELSMLPWDKAEEIVFCGFGEPTMRLEVLTGLLRRIRAERPGVKTRLNTNGLSDLYFGRDTAPDFDGLLDTISISLNASNAERYLELTRSRFGLPSFEAMLTFAERAKAYVPDVVLTVVDHVEDDGEILISAPTCIMEGYYKMPDATREVIRGGILHTGDLGFFDERGLLHVSGRKKEMLVLSDGTKVFLPEYESELSAVLHGRDLAVCERNGSPVLVIRGRPGEREAVLAAIKPVMELRPRGQQIKDVIFTPSPLPRTSTGKIKRWELNL